MSINHSQHQRAINMIYCALIAARVHPAGEMRGKKTLFIHIERNRNIPGKYDLLIQNIKPDAAPILGTLLDKMGFEDIKLVASGDRQARLSFKSRYPDAIAHIADYATDPDGRENYHSVTGHAIRNIMRNATGRGDRLPFDAAKRTEWPAAPVHSMLAELLGLETKQKGGIILHSTRGLRHCS